jgi:hypothetical protein
MKFPLRRVKRQLNRTSKVQRCSHSTLGQIFLVLITLCIPSFAASKTSPLPDEVLSAKSIYLDNQTGHQAVLDTANYEFNKWGRFTIAKSREDADLIVVFTHSNAMGKWGNIGITKMDVFLKGSSEPAFHAESNASFISQPQLKTSNCVAYFRDRIEPKN